MSPDIDAVDVDAVSGAAPAPVNAEFAALTNRQKVAILLAQLGAKGAAPILKEMSDEETILVTKEIVRLPPLSNATVTAVVAEFMERFGRSDEHGLGGVTLAREFLEERLGVTRAEEVMVQIEGPSSSSPLSTFMKNDPEQVLGVLSAQQPQVIAVLLSYLPPAEAARLLAGLEPALRTEVARRVAHLTSVDPVAVRQITSLLVGKLQAQSGGGASTVAGGTSAMADILSHADRSVEQQVLGDLEAHDADLAKEIRAGMLGTLFRDAGRIEALEDTLAAFPNARRRICRLYHIEGVAASQIALQSDCGPSNISNSLRRCWLAFNTSATFRRALEEITDESRAAARF